MITSPRTARLIAASAAAAFAAGAAAAAPAHAGVDYANPIVSKERFTLQPNTTKTYTMPIAGLGQGANVLQPCWGFEVRGPGVNLVAAGLETYGTVVPEPGHENRPDGGVPGAERQPDGTFAISADKAVLGAFQARQGASCSAIGWAFSDASGRARLDANGDVASGAVGARAASRAQRRIRRMRRQISQRARQAQAGAVTVTLAGLRNPAGPAEIVVTIRTGDVPAGTTLTTHARVLPQTVSAERPR